MSDSETEASYPPWNFSWVVPGKLAAMAWPQNIQNLNYLVEQGINHVITLSPEKIPPILMFTKLKWTQMPVKEFEPPSIKQVLDFINICQRGALKNEVVGIHCRMGRGRTGVMAACYLIHFEGLSAQRAMTVLRMSRPGSIETPEQERTVLRYYDCFMGLKPDDMIDIEEESIVKLIARNK